MSAFIASETRFLSVFLGLLRRQSPPLRRGSFFKILNGLRVLSVMFGPSSQLAIAHSPYFTAQRLLAHRNAKLFPKPLRQIAQTPANNTVEKGVGPRSIACARAAHC